MRLRTGLLLVAAATAAPLLVFAFLAAAFAFSQERESFVATSLARNRAVLAAVDAELLGAVYVLRSLGGSASLRKDDLEGFYRDANATLHTQPSWQNVVLQRTDGAQLINARAKYGAPLPQKAIDQTSLDAVISTKEPSYANLSQAPLFNNELGVAVRVPIVREDRVVYVLTAVLSPRSFQHVLEDQLMPSQWVSGLVGTDGRVIARVPRVSPGSLASGDYRAHVAVSKDGWYRGKTIEGEDTFTAFSKSDITGWTIGFAMPSAVILGASQRAAKLMGAGILLSVCAALLIGFWLSRRIAQPMSEIAQSAQLLGSGKPWRHISSGLVEVEQLSGALAAAAATISQRDREIERSQEELRRQAAALISADANRATFLVLLAHELRNFLAPLKAGLSLLSRQADAGPTDKTRAMMASQILAMTRLVDDLLDIGRIDRGELEMRHQRIDMAEVIRVAVDVASAGMEAKQQTLSAANQAHKFYVNGDAVRLSQVLANLLTNASKYTPEGGQISLGLRLEGDRVIVAVTDSGAGFDEALKDRIFEKFVRLDETKHQHAAGLGIGLTISKFIVEAHRGTISATSSGSGHGATFTVALPAAFEGPAV